MSEIMIDSRFCGPPESGNGGYCCGLLAEQIEGPADVMLMAPPPLDTPLRIETRGDDVFLCDGDNEIGKATPTTIDLVVPSSPSFAESEKAVPGYLGFLRHPFPRCFVCGPAREAGDGLRLFPGPTGDAELVATPWIPDASLADDNDNVRNEFMWSALDCPSYFGLKTPTLTALLARMQAEVVTRPRIASRLIVVGWRISQAGRKYQAGSAIYDEDGTLLARALALWIELRHNAPGHP